MWQWQGKSQNIPPENLRTSHSNSAIWGLPQSEISRRTNFSGEMKIPKPKTGNLDGTSECSGADDCDAPEFVGVACTSQFSTFCFGASKAIGFVRLRMFCWLLPHTTMRIYLETQRKAVLRLCGRWERSACDFCFLWRVTTLFRAASYHRRQWRFVPKSWPDVDSETEINSHKKGLKYFSGQALSTRFTRSHHAAAHFKATSECRTSQKAAK